MTDREAVVKVLIIGNEAQFARVIARTISSDPAIEVVGMAQSTDCVGSTSGVDVAIVDVDAEPPDEILQRLQTKGEQVKVCALSFHEHGELLEHCLASGIDAYVVKSSAHELPDAIRAISDGHGYADPRAAAALLCSGPSRRRALSAREREIVRLVAQGLTNREIGHCLAISEKTIKNHVSHVLAKLNCRARSQIAVTAIRIGLA